MVLGLWRSASQGPVGTLRLLVSEVSVLLVRVRLVAAPEERPERLDRTVRRAAGTLSMVQEDQEEPPEQPSTVSAS